MKKISLILFCGVILLGVCGCSSTKTEENSTQEKNKEMDTLYGNTKYNIKCDEIKDIVDFSIYDSLFITNDGKLYQLSFNKLFSNEKNCKQVESDITFNKFIRGGILDSQNNIYYFDKENNTLKLYNFEGGYTTMPNLKDIDKNNYNNVSSTFKPNDIIPIYLYENENKVYIYEEKIHKLILNNEPIFVLENDEKIEYFIDGTIKTNKNFYTYSSQIINKEECDKYADIKCNYVDSYYKSNVSTNNIKFYKKNVSFETIIVDNDNNVYTNVFGG